MAWFRNHYRCERCASEWTDEWSCMCDDDCPYCSARHMSPYESEDLTCVIVRCGGMFVVLQSPNTAEHWPNYHELAQFRTRKQARAYLAKALDSEPA